MRRLALKLLLFLAALEVTGSFLLSHQGFWYQNAQARFAREEVKYLFIGSSRVASAVVPGAFAREVGLPESAILNTGRGYSTLAEHFFGVRRLAEASPSRLRGTVVFLEAPGETPDFTTWEDPWFDPGYPELLPRTMELSDLPHFLSQSPGPFEQKLGLGLAKVSSLVALRGSWKFYAAKVRAGGNNAQEADLSAAGGVQTDGEKVRRNRELAITRVESLLAREVPLEANKLDHGVLKSLVELVRSEGGRLVLFTTPISSLNMKLYQTPTAEKNRDTAAKAIASWGIPLLRVEFPTTDEDFPDLSHLRRSRAPAFSRALARSWLTAQKGS